MDGKKCLHWGLIRRQFAFDQAENLLAFIRYLGQGVQGRFEIEKSFSEMPTATSAACLFDDEMSSYLSESATVILKDFPDQVN